MDDVLKILPYTPQLDLLIVEFEPGQTDALAVVQAVKARFPNVPVLFAGTSEDFAPWIRFPQPCRYLTKPFTLRQLMSRVSWLLA